MLSILTDGPAHGYAVRQKIEAATGLPLAVGTLYPLLHRLESRGWVRADRLTIGGRQRKRYELTAAGKTHFRGLAADWHAAFARMQGMVLPALRRVRTAGPTAPIDGGNPQENFPD